MLKKVPIRLRLTVLSVLLLTICCIGLTVILNLSANQMADVIEATPISPANEIFPGETPGEQSFPAVGAELVVPSISSQEARDRFLYQSVVYVILLVLIGGGLTYYLSGRSLQPLKELSAQMKNRTVHNLAEDLPIPQTKDEVADLTRSFNQMSTKLNEAFAMQKRFSQSAAHELRTPLTVLKTKVDVFNKKSSRAPEEYDKLLSVITDQTNRLSDLVKDLLDLANTDDLECGEKIELKSLLTGVTQDLSELAREKNITLKIEGEERTVNGNKSLLHRAFYNLAENAIKYNVENGKIAIKLGCDGNRTRITIADTGIGVPQELQGLIFEPFFRVDKSRSRQMGGAGLGLATVKSIIDMHSGSIRAFDKTGGGTVFEVIL